MITENACICYFAAQIFAVYSRYSSLNAFITHYVGVLRHCAEQIAFLDQTGDRIRLIEANANDVSIAGCLDGIACTSCGTFVAAEDTNYALSDVVLSDCLRFRSITFAVLSLKQFEIGSFKSRTESCLTLYSRICRSVYVYDTDGTGSDAFFLPEL